VEAAEASAIADMQLTVRAGSGEFCGGVGNRSLTIDT
jgi:hypothetical protein